jgi:DNA-binding beta-propeller fold protein YncE
LVVLDYRVVDAEQSASLKSVVMISDTPSNALHIFDEVTQVDRTVSLPLAPVAVSVAPDGKNAAVAYDANVSWIDLQTATIRKTCALSSNSYDLSLINSGIAYVVPRTDQWISLHSVDLNDCSEVTSSTLRAGSHIALHPSAEAVFTADQGLSPSRIQRCNITMSSPTCTDAQNNADWGTYSYCGNLWISQDGQRIYSACGVTLRVPGNLNVDVCTYGGTLEGVSGIQHMSEAAEVQKIVLIPNGSDGTLRIQETNFLAFVRMASLPAFPLTSSTTVQSHGRFVFTTPTLDMVYVVVQADASGGAMHDYAIASFAP